ncbi:DUF441 domain-containing protein [Sporomusa acidovorans]|uniref:UPF0756 membrane protein SPACI_024970 n=1 Tax=Sporomusa acidovorans (strain ATCC 49682 / DSM 3132 / Mol) TaxID=1123286 RepID=A0ABZ3J304_SPOA4|nr:DUF441 domain-containing protein [Sporomusa acidovorans]OZC19942.1 hypothetical protein SPACI_23390 [Sporomusa acidovorans DSM 3132]SDD49364.1 Uncharacterized membrane protein, DUF441 family [Sporomusa acidovorans]
MSFENLPLLVLLLLSVLGNNQSVAIAAGLLLILKLLGLNALFPIIESKGISIGITILTFAILAPLATGRITLGNILSAFKSPITLIALASGIFVAWTAGRGLLFINASPEIVTSLVLGTVFGVCFLQGIAIGPLIAGGLVSLVVAFTNLIK